MVEINKVKKMIAEEMYCFACNKPVDLSEIHYSLTEQMEQDVDGEVQPLYGNYIAVAHKKCRQFRI